MSKNFAFDCDKWRVNTSNLFPRTQTSGSGANAYSASTQTIFRRNAMWRGAIVINPLFGADVQDFHGWLAGLQGKRNTFDLCLCDPFSLKLSGLTHDEFVVRLGLNPDNLCETIGGRYGIPFSDGTCFSDGTGFDIPDFTPVTVSVDALEGASQISMAGSVAYLKRGSKFSTGDSYCHEITSIAGNVVSFTPELRRNLSAGEPLDTENPKIRVRLSSDDAGIPDVRHARYTGEITLEVVEVLSR